MRLLVSLIDLYSLVVLAAVVMSWVPSMRENTVGQWIESVTEPVLSRIRSALPAMGGMDLSPLILLLALRLVKDLLLRG